MKSAFDQTIHFAFAFAFVWAFGAAEGWHGAAQGLILGVIREASEAGGARIMRMEVIDHFRKRDPWIDLLFWSLGGFVAALAVSI